jgi:two-component system, sensor histidine kinase and response regulator
MNYIPKVLVVDDQPINVALLKRKLEQEKLQVLTASGGIEALELVQRDRPDLILLDVMMPEMDGIEVCQRLQGDTSTKSIPVIFITARSSKEGKLTGLGVGAVDYITKPIDLDETAARVHTHLRLVLAHREMLELQARLDESRRQAATGAITQGVAHNLNNLLGVALGYLDAIKHRPERVESVKSNAENLENSLGRIVSMIRQLGSVVVRSRPPSIAVSVDRVLRGTLDRYHLETSREDPIHLETHTEADTIIETHVEMFEEVMGKLLHNAWESYGTQHEGPRPIWITASLVNGNPSQGRCLEICIDDAGLGINPEVRDHMYEAFISTKNTVGVGMGLTVARHSLRNMNGDVSHSDRPSGGTRARVLHPLERRRKTSA